MTMGDCLRTNKLIILRGNSGSGKTTIAKELQQVFGNNTMLISQDVSEEICSKSKTEKIQRRCLFWKNFCDMEENTARLYSGRNTECGMVSCII